MAALYDGNQCLAQRYRNVVITEGSLINLKDKPSPGWKALGFGVSKAHQGFAELPNVPDELRAIIRDEANGRINGVLPGRIMLDDNFTEKSFEDALLRRQYRVVHIASHFTINTDGNSEDSFLLLGEGKLSKLTMAQIAAIPDLFADVELLTLSACNTAIGGSESSSSEKQGVEFESLGVLAQQEGAASVLASLWEVSDASTSLLMRDFYRVREEQLDATKADALQRAQLNLLLQSNGKYTHPFYWAPFVLIGNWK
jgi:CHAT domain-containing protein